MKVYEILLQKGAPKSDLMSVDDARQVHVLRKRMNQYTDKILDPLTSPKAREFLKLRLKDDYHELREIVPQFHAVEDANLKEAVTKLPLTDKDFKAVMEIMKNPIPAVVAPIYIQEIIEDDELNDQLNALSEDKPGEDVRPLIAEWFNRVMPDQMYRFTGNVRDDNQKNGVFSPLHGYDPKMYKGTNDPITGDAYGSF